VTTFEVEATFVGHDLNRGTSEFRRRRPAPATDRSTIPASPEAAAGDGVSSEPESPADAA
jgi:hypothetical protein